MVSGRVFLEDVMKPLGLTVTDAAQMLGVSRKALSEFVNEKASLSPLDVGGLINANPRGDCGTFTENR